MIPAQSSPESKKMSSAKQYRSRLHPWCLLRVTPDGSQTIVQRFRKQSEAGDYLRHIQKRMPLVVHQIAFLPIAQFDEASESC
jgi:hypothetical protein